MQLTLSAAFLCPGMLAVAGTESHLRRSSDGTSHHLFMPIG